MMNTCFILTHFPNPRMNKRIAEFLRFGSVSVICVRRKDANIWNQSYDDVDYHICDMAFPPSSQIVKRGILSKKFQKYAFDITLDKNPDVCYVSDLDALLVAKKIKKHNPKLKIIFEVPDLRELYLEKPHGLAKKLIKQAVLFSEKRAFRYVNNLVVTSPKFYDMYYCNLITSDKVLFIPNAPNRDFFEGYTKKRDGKFTVGFIGGIRYLEQMKNLVDAAEQSDCNVLFAGAGATKNDYDEILDYCQYKDHVVFSGQYDYSSDIANLYGRVDCVYAVYDADNANVRIALPNKLYESIVCRLPIIVAKGTYLSELVESWGVGISVNHHSVNELCNALILLQSKEYRTILEEKCETVEKELYSDALASLIKGYAETLSH